MQPKKFNSLSKKFNLVPKNFNFVSKKVFFVPINFNLVSKHFNWVLKIFNSCPEKVNLVPKKIKIVRKIKKSKIKKYLIDSVGFLVSRSVCDVIVLGAANIQEIIHVIAHKTKNIKICIEQCLVSQGKRPTSFYIPKYKHVVKQFCAKLRLMLTWNVPHRYAY